MTPIYLPRVDQLPIAPELATLSALDAALHAADQVLGLQHGMHDPRELREPDTRIASEIVVHARVLRDLIQRYAQATIGDDGDR